MAGKCIVITLLVQQEQTPHMIACMHAGTCQAFPQMVALSVKQLLVNVQLWRCKSL